MLARITLAFCLLAGVSAWCQETAPTTDAAKTTDNDSSQLQVPPPVSNQAYASTFSGETESNYLRGGITLTSAYLSNVSWGTSPTSDMSYSIWPTIAIDKTTYRTHFVLDYAPGFTFYQHTTALNAADQNLNGNLQYQISPNLKLSVQELFSKTSNIFNQPNPVSTTTVSGSVPVSNVAIVAPVAETLSNLTNVQFSYQVSAEAMLGGGGNYSTLSYLDASQVTGLYNSRTAGGSFFYSTRFREKNYLGVSYQYQNSLAFQSLSPSVLTETQTVFFFFTRYLKPNLTLSLSAGPQHYSSVQALQPTAAAWQPMTMVSLSWQGERTTVAGSYSRTVSGGGGLNGTFHNTNASASVSWRASRNWTANASGGYSNYDNLVPYFLLTNPGGHTLLGAASLSRTLNDHANLQFGYSWVHQSYEGVQSISTTPNTNRVFVTLNFTFSRPLHQ